MENIVNITKSAENYLAKLLKDKNEPNLAVRIFISDPGTPKAETCLAYCKPEEAHKDDVILKLKKITVHVEKRSIPFLVDAEVNYDNDTFGGQLTIKAPNARLPNISPDSPVEDRKRFRLRLETLLRLLTGRSKNLMVWFKRLMIQTELKLM